MKVWKTGSLEVHFHFDAFQPTANRQLPTANHQPSTVNRQPSTKEK